MKRPWRIFKESLEALSYFGVAIGIFFAASEYIEAKHLQSEKNALEFIRDSQSSKLSDARLILQRHWRDYPINEINGKPGSAEVFDQLALSNTLESNEPSGTDSLVQIVDFLDVVGTCVETGVCDSQIIQLHLGDFARNISCLYQVPLQILRTERGLSTLGSKLQVLASDQHQCGFAER